MASVAGGSGTGGGDVVECMCRGIKCVCVVESMYVFGMHRLVFVMHLVALFCHSNDAFIGAHIEIIENFKKCMFWIMNMSLTLILR